MIRLGNSFGSRVRGFVCRSTNNPLGLAAVISVTLAASALFVESKRPPRAPACTCDPALPPHLAPHLP